MALGVGVCFSSISSSPDAPPGSPSVVREVESPLLLLSVDPPAELGPWCD